MRVRGRGSACLRIVSGILGGLLRVILLRPSASETEGNCQDQQRRTCQIEHTTPPKNRGHRRTSFLEAESIDAVADPLIFLKVRSAAHGGGARLDAQGRYLDKRRDRQSRGLQRRASSTQGERLCACTGKLGGFSEQPQATGGVARR